MTLLILILIAIPICILIILLWIYNDYRKYKKQQSFLLLLFWTLPATMQAQYVDKNCCISFKWHENQQGKLECINGNLTYEFIPNESFWKIIIRNNSSDARKSIGKMRNSSSTDAPQGYCFTRNQNLPLQKK